MAVREVEEEEAAVVAGEKRISRGVWRYLDPTRWTLKVSPRGQVTLFFFLQ